MPIDEDNVKALMNKIDTNHDGVIDFNEWQVRPHLSPLPIADLDLYF
jgi:hypothetical protein